MDVRGAEVQTHDFDLSSRLNPKIPNLKYEVELIYNKDMNNKKNN